MLMNLVYAKCYRNISTGKWWQKNSNQWTDMDTHTYRCEPSGLTLFSCSTSHHCTGKYNIESFHKYLHEIMLTSVSIIQASAQNHTETYTQSRNNRMFDVLCSDLCCTATIIHLKLKCQNTMDCWLIQSHISRSTPPTTWFPSDI